MYPVWIDRSIYILSPNRVIPNRLNFTPVKPDIYICI